MLLYDLGYRGRPNGCRDRDETSLLFESRPFHRLLQPTAGFVLSSLSIILHVITLDVINASRYGSWVGKRRAEETEMIRSYRCRETKKIFERKHSKKLPGDIQRIALRKLVLLHAAERLDDLRIPPGNRLEALSGTRKGQHSIRINSQWRICFVWTDAGSEEVEIVDYH